MKTHCSHTKSKFNSIATRTYHPDVNVHEELANIEKINRRRLEALIDSSKLSANDSLKAKSNDKIVIPDSDKVFKYSCGGKLIGNSDLNGQYIEWNATFDKPIEQLIYPSLQRFDTESTIDNRNTKNVSRKKVHISSPPHDHQLLLDPLPIDQLPTNEEIVFIHAPKWSMNIRMDSKDADEELDENTSKDIDKKGELYLRSKIKENALKSIESKATEVLKKIASNKDTSTTTKSESSSSSSLLNIRPISRGGERMGRRGAEIINVSSAKLMQSSDQLYQSLVRDSRNSRISREQQANNIKKLLNDKNEPSNEDSFRTEVQVFNKHKSMLLRSLPQQQNHLLDGLLFYRYQNENHKAELEHEREIHQVLMRKQSKQVVGRKNSTVDAFSLRFARRKKTHFDLHLDSNVISKIKEKTINEMKIITSHDINNTEKLDELLKEKYSEDSFSRVQRAISGINKGLEPNQAIIISSGSSGGGGMKGKDNNRRAGFSIDPIVFQKNLVINENDNNDDTYQELVIQTNTRHAQDILLLNQIEKGILPEQFIKQSPLNDDPSHISIMISKYGIGDTRGLCLGKCLSALTHLDSIGLSNNRLTAVSLPTIIENLCVSSLIALDLSFNVMHGPGIVALSSFFKSKTVLEVMDLSSCGITCADAKLLFSTLKTYNNHIDEIALGSNLIAEEGAEAICSYLVSSHCQLRELDLSWNSIGEMGAIYFANLAMVNNKTLKDLNLSSNGIGDNGGQYIANSLKYHSKINNFNISQNEISDRSCFVFTQVLRKHPSLLKLDLANNCLGSAGARSLFRNILRGINAWVSMENCTIFENLNTYNHTYPSNDNPYVLDLSEPYKAAILSELLLKYVDDPVNCSFESLTYREDKNKGGDSSINIVVQNKKVCLKSTGEAWIIPDKGIVKFSFHQAVCVPTEEHVISPVAFDMLMRIVEAGREVDRKKDVDRKKIWLALLCQDANFTTKQARHMIDRFYRNKTIGDGELTKSDVLKCIWNYLVDTENKFDFLFDNTTEEQRKDVIYSLTIKRYKFNWANPTANWKLNLEDNSQRTILMQIIAINNAESEFSKNHSNRGDTSQHGNWYNFRNSKYTINKETKEIVIDREFIKNLPSTGTLEFDYVSTTRPNISLLHFDSDDEIEDDEHEYKNKTNATIHNKQPNDNNNKDSTVGIVSNDKQHLLITDSKFFYFMDRLKLSARKKISNAAALFILLDLQLASTRYYFTINQIHSLLEAFEEDWQIQSKVIVCMFSRIVDLHRMDVLLRNLDRKTQQEVMKRLGYLNVMNPLKISFDFSLCLKYLDNRILLISLMELAAIESADQIIEELSSELPIQSIYGAYTRTLNESRPETMKFHFTDFGKRTKNVSWSSRKDLLKKFLVGTLPIDDKLYTVISQYKELESANKLTEGPIDLQYSSYIKDSKSLKTKAIKSRKSMINMMKAAAKLSK